MYQNEVNNLESDYEDYKYSINRDYNNVMMNVIHQRDDYRDEIAKLQMQCYRETESYRQQIAQLEREMGNYNPSMNSYQKTQYDKCKQQINNLNIKISDAEMNYGDKIKVYQKKIDELPTADEVEAAKKAELARLDAWYKEQLQALKDYYYGM